MILRKETETFKVAIIDFLYYTIRMNDTPQGDGN